VALLPACTTSRPVLLWHEAWRAEQQGDFALAERRYQEAYGIDGSLLGAACNRLRLLARQPDRLVEARDLAEKLMKSKGIEPEAAACASMFALVDGDASLAAKRLAAVRALKPADSQQVRQNLAAAKLVVAVANGQWQAALAVADLPTDGTAVQQGMAIAKWNAKLPDVVTPTGLPELAAWRAAERGDWSAVRTGLDTLPQRTPILQALMAWALLQLGDATGALPLATDAGQRAPADAFCQEAWGVAALATGQTAMAVQVLGSATLHSPGWTSFFHLGLAQIQQGDLPAALASFDQASLRCPTCAPAIRNRDALRAAGLR
jgi:Flp pilus assembly protein TadD